MKKIICICLLSGCDKSLSHGRPVNAVAEDKAPHSLTANTSNASASVPSITPAPTSSPKETVPVLPDSAASSSLIFKEEVE
ncbi:MAG: hypothetical protein LE169_05740 [Endomicrobium sp.]|nr:hypothetical protein [Endomicrobium sp.]